MTKDDKLIDTALAETGAQTEILKALRPLDRLARTRVLIAVKYLMLADEQIPGIFSAVGRGLAKPQ